VSPTADGVLIAVGLNDFHHNVRHSGHNNVGS
jgi:hypothetical protein